MRGSAPSGRATEPTPNGFDDVVASSGVIIVCGSGGVGKTTTAAAIALGAAERTPSRVLVLTIDPAKRLADALGLKAVGNEASRVMLGPVAKGELSIAMLDTSASWDDLVRANAPDASTADKILVNPLYRNITQRFVQSHDYIAMERLYELRAAGDYDLIVIDTPPSRHALDFLDAPSRMSDFFSSTLLKWITLPYRIGGERAGRLGYLASRPFYQIADRILGSDFLRDIAEFFLLFQSMYGGFVQRADAVSALLREPSTTFVVVSTLEPAPLSEAEFFLNELERRKLSVGAMVLNRTLPPVFADAGAIASARQLAHERVGGADRSGAGAGAGAASGELARARKAVGETFLRFASIAGSQTSQELRLARHPDVVLRVPLMDRPIVDLDALTGVVEHLWSEGAATRSTGRHTDARSSDLTTRKKPRTASS